MIEEEDAERLTDALYTLYGSHTGVLFGIPSRYRSAVGAVVKALLCIIPQERGSDG